MKKYNNLFSPLFLWLLKRQDTCVIYSWIVDMFYHRQHALYWELFTLNQLLGVARADVRHYKRSLDGFYRRHAENAEGVLRPSA